MARPPTQRPFDVLLAVDGSEHSLAATYLLGDLPLPAGSVVRAVAVLVPRDASSHAALSAALAQAAELLQGRGLQVTTELRVGYPAAELAECADREKPDLMVLGARGLRAALGILLGGVVQQIVEYALWPVLVVRAPYQGLRTILLVTDGSAYSQRALEYLAALPLPAAVAIKVAHVLPPLPVPVHLTHTWPAAIEAVSSIPDNQAEKAVSRQAEEEEREGQILLDRSVEALHERGVEAGSVLLRGDAATEIIEYVKAHQVDLIVAGSRGLSTMKRLLVGSLSRKLVHYAGCSVLLVKGGVDGAV